MKGKILISLVFLILGVTVAVVFLSGNESQSGDKNLDISNSSAEENNADTDVEKADEDAIVSGDEWNRLAAEENSIYPGAEVIILGCYEQDRDKQNGKEPIEWIVLDEQDDRLLVISKYVLLRHKYGDVGSTWETSLLRDFLNNDFFVHSFSEEEKERIMLTELENPDNSIYKTEGGNPTSDRVFILSCEEADKFFTMDEQMKTFFTPYAAMQQYPLYYGMSDKGRVLSGGLLRTPGETEQYVCRQSATNSHWDTFADITSWDLPIRPAMWITKE